MTHDTASALTGGPFPEAAREWVLALEQGTSDSDRTPPRDSSEYPSTSTFSPQSLKKVFVSVLSIGRERGLLEQAMGLLAGQEAALRQLREQIGIERAASIESLPRAIVLAWTGDAWMSPGRWVPDILDRAAAFDPLHEVVTDDLGWQEVAFAEIGAVEHLFVMNLHPDETPTATSIQALAKRFPDGRIHEIDNALDWLSPGPGVMRAIFDAASRIHGVPDLFSS